MKTHSFRSISRAQRFTRIDFAFVFSSSANGPHTSRARGKFSNGFSRVESTSGRRAAFHRIRSATRDACRKTTSTKHCVYLVPHDTPDADRELMSFFRFFFLSIFSDANRRTATPAESVSDVRVRVRRAPAPAAFLRTLISFHANSIRRERGGPPGNFSVRKV